MPRLQTTGTHSCATIALGDFKTKDQYEVNVKYLEDQDPNKFRDKEYIIIDDALTVQEFIDDILYPTKQDLGRTNLYCFDHLMDMIDRTDLGAKWIILILTDFQKAFQNGYWVSRVEARGFTQIDVTENNWGGTNYIYVRNNSPEGSSYDEDDY